MSLLFHLQDWGSIWNKVADQGTAVVVLFMILFFGLLYVVKVLPTWKAVRLDANAAQTQMAGALALVANAITDSNKTRALEMQAITHLADVVQSIAVEQRKANESIRIMQRVQADSTDDLTDFVQELNQRLAQLEQGSPILQTYAGRPKTNSKTTN